MKTLTVRRIFPVGLIALFALLLAGCSDSSDSPVQITPPDSVTLLPQYSFTVSDAQGDAGPLTLQAQIAGNPATVQVTLGNSMHGTVNLQSGDWVVQSASSVTVDTDTALGSFAVDVTTDIVMPAGDTPVSGAFTVTSATGQTEVTLASEGVNMVFTPVSDRIVASTLWSEGNGNRYMIVEFPGQSWDSARADLEAFLPAFQLATVTSAEEDAAVMDMVMSNSVGALWLGGYQDPITETDPAAGWTWVTGEPWDYTHWQEMEPNDAGVPGLEQHLALELAGWNDEGSAIGVISGYLAEGPGERQVSWEELEGLLDEAGPAWMKQAALATAAAEFVLGQALQVAGMQALILDAFPDQNPVTVMCDAFTGSPPPGVINQGMFVITWLGSGEVTGGDSFNWRYTECWMQELAGEGTLIDGDVDMMGYVMQVNASNQLTGFGFSGAAGGVIFTDFISRQTTESAPGVHEFLPSETLTVNGGVSVQFTE